MERRKTKDRQPAKLLWQAEYAWFRKRLVAARLRSGMSQREAARRLGRSQSFVAQSENGQRRVDVVELKAFAKVYGRAIAYFI